MDIDVVEIYQRGGRLGGRAQWRWRYVAAGNQKKLATSGEGYGNYADCLAAMERVLLVPFSHGNTRRSTGDVGHWRVARPDGSQVLVVVSGL